MEDVSGRANSVEANACGTLATIISDVVRAVCVANQNRTAVSRMMNNEQDFEGDRNNRKDAINCSL